MNLNQITLPVNDLEVAAAFYRRMGFLQIVDSPEYARFESIEGEASFSLSYEEGHGSYEEDKGQNSSVIYFECSDLDAQVSALKEKGFSFTQEPTDMRWLWREAILYDPSGNKVKLYHAGENRLNPPWRVEQRG